MSNQRLISNLGDLGVSQAELNVARGQYLDEEVGSLREAEEREQKALKQLSDCAATVLVPGRVARV